MLLTLLVTGPESKKKENMTMNDDIKIKDEEILYALLQERDKLYELQYQLTHTIDTSFLQGLDHNLLKKDEPSVSAQIEGVIELLNDVRSRLNELIGQNLELK